MDSPIHSAWNAAGLESQKIAYRRMSCMLTWDWHPQDTESAAPTGRCHGSSLPLWLMTDLNQLRKGRIDEPITTCVIWIHAMVNRMESFTLLCSPKEANDEVKLHQCAVRFLRVHTHPNFPGYTGTIHSRATCNMSTSIRLSSPKKGY